jgi:MoxR-like ATPase
VTKEELDIIEHATGRDYVTPDDVKFIALDVLRHRIGRSYEALAEKISTDEIIREILESVRIP